MRIAFLGTPEFAVPSLERLVEEGFHIAAVVTQPDRPKGRGKKLSAPPVKETALRFGFPVHQPEKIKRPEVVEFFRGLEVEAMAVVAYGKIIPQSIIDIPPLGLVNIHASLLPNYRGAAPIEWAVAEGESRTGVTTMLIDAGLDSGDILLAEETEIGPEETAAELRQRLAPLGAELLVRTLRGLERGTVTPRPQDDARASLAPMLKKEHGRIDWTWRAERIHNRVRGFQPWPGAYTGFRGRSLHVWKSRLADREVAGEPGVLAVEHHRLFVACGEGPGLELLEVQIEGRKRTPVADFINGQHPVANEILGGDGE